MWMLFVSLYVLGVIVALLGFVWVCNHERKKIPHAMKLSLLFSLAWPVIVAMMVVDFLVAKKID